MRKLVRGGFAHIRTMWGFWIGILVFLGYGLLIVIGNYRMAVKYDDVGMADAFTESLFQSTTIIGVVAAVFCSLFVGMEYSDGTVRNKIIVGQSRTAIYMGNFINCMAAGMGQVFAASAVYWSVGFILMGKPQIGAAEFLWVCIMLVFLCASYAAVFNLSAMLISSRTHAAILNILMAIAMLVAATYIFSMLSQPEVIHQYPMFLDSSAVLSEAAMETVPNPHYVSGLKRDIYQFLLDFLPGGQSLELADLDLLKTVLDRPVLTCAYSFIIIVAANLTGIALFRRKDIK